MNSLRPLSLALVASAAIAWTLPTNATQPPNCANGKTVYNKTNASVPTACSNSNCHGTNPANNKNNILNGQTPFGITNALDGTAQNAAMTALDLRNNLPLSDSEIDDISAWIFYAPTCPSGGPVLQAAPAPVVFASTPVGATSATTTVTITNSGTGAASAVTASSNDATHFPLSFNTCSSVTVNVGAACSFRIAFHPAAVGPLGATVTISRTGGSPQAVAVSGTGIAGTAPAIVTVVEYHNSDFDHYFVTPVAAEIALLDARAPPFQAWSRTGFSFKSYVNATAPATSFAICRFFNSTFAPKSSHFYAPHGLGCEATIAGFPDWNLEDDKLFNSMLPDTNGSCPAGTLPVYRLYNNGMGGAPNHRFVTDLTERQRMLSTGFVAEGAGIGVGMCVPP